MSVIFRLGLLISGAASITANGAAQEADMLVQDTVVVEGSRGNPMMANVEPEEVLDFAEIRSYGAESLQDLLADLAPLTNSSRGSGAPAVLLNGRRISGFREIRNYPPEALARIEILPEAVALKFGFRADQKVINIILRNRFHALTGAASLAMPTEGGQAISETDLSNLRIRDERRWNIDLNLERQDALFESDRDIISLGGSSADRSLEPEQVTAGLTASYSHFLPGDVAATYTLGLDGSDQKRTLAQTGSQDTLERQTDTWGANASFVFNKVYDDWNWSLNGSVAHQDSDSRTDPVLMTGLSEVAQTSSDQATLEAVGFFKIAQLPAGDLVTTLKAGVDAEDFSSSSSILETTLKTDLSRETLNAQINLDAPLLDRDMPRNPFGAVSLNANARIDDVSDVGSLITHGLGVTLQPTSNLQIIASTSRAEDAPSLQDLGNPLSSVDNARIFDFLPGTTVEDVRRLSGGNPNLRPETRTVHDLNLSWDPFEKHDVTFNLDYTETETEDAILSFPGLTPEIETAFPDRVTRDASGTLTQLDARPINIAESTRREISYGLNWSIRLPRRNRPDLDTEEREQLREIFFRRLDEEDRARIEKRIAEFQARRAAGNGRPQRAGAGRGGRPRGGGGRGGFGSGRLFLSLNHTTILEDELRIGADSLPLDLLNGDAISDRGGSSEHQITAQAGASSGPLGGFMRVAWQSSTTIDDGTGAGLRFGALTTTNLRLQYNFERNTKLLLKYPFLDSTRVSLGVSNLFDAKQDVTDQTGAVPINFQPDLLDPRGRTVSLRIRKLFY